MKKTAFFLMAVLGVGLAMSSCNNEIVDGDTNEQKEKEGDGYISMMLEFPEKGASTYAEEDGDANENKVSVATVVFFKANTVYEVMDFVYDSLTVSGNKYKTKAMKVEKDDYDIVVLVNKPTALNIVKGTTDKAYFETKAGVVMDTLTNTTKGFFMTNATGYKKVTPGHFKPTDVAALSTPVAVKVERAVAKVVVMGAGPISVTGGTVTDADINWAVDVTNKEMYWMRKQTKKLEQNGSVWEAGAMETEDDYTSTGREYLYAEDPNFAGHSSTEAGLFNRITAADVSKVLSTIDAPGTGYVCEYVPENTMQAEDQFRNVSTSVVIKLVYVPSAISDATTDGYFIYNGTAIDYTTMSGFIADPTSVPAVTYPGLAALLTANTVSTAASGEYTNGGNTLTFYKNGVSYFNVPIKHFASQTTTMGYGRYGVVRNNVYKLTINSIKGPGKIEPSPEDWEDDEESYISVEFEIMPWYIRTQVIDL